MTATAHELSTGLQKVIDDFSAGKDSGEGIEIEQIDLLTFLEILDVLKSLALKLETELLCLRDSEAGREARTFLEREATDRLADMIPEGNVVHLKFGGANDE